MKESKCTCQWQPAGGLVSTTAAWPESMDLLRRARRVELPMTLCTSFTPNAYHHQNDRIRCSVLSPTLPKHLCTAFWLYSTQTSKSTLPGESRWTYPIHVNISKDQYSFLCGQIDTNFQICMFSFFLHTVKLSRWECLVSGRSHPEALYTTPEQLLPNNLSTPKPCSNDSETKENSPDYCQRRQHDDWAAS